MPELNLLDLEGKGWYGWLCMMRVSKDREEQEERLGEEARKVGTRHMFLGFLLLIFLLFVIGWCSLPGR